MSKISLKELAQDYMKSMQTKSKRLRLGKDDKRQQEFCFYRTQRRHVFQVDADYRRRERA